MSNARELAELGGSYGTGGFVGMKNRIINGAGLINQRVVSGTVTLSAGAYGHDRFKAGASGCTYTFSTSNNVTTFTITAGSLIQVIEGLNLESGTYCLSWTGTAQGKIGAGSYSASGVTGSITGGTNTNIEFNTGTLSLPQLEKGSTATSFDYRPYGTELALCQRYYQKTYDIGTTPATATKIGSLSSGHGMTGINTTGGIGSCVALKVNMRSAPTVTLYDQSGNAGKVNRNLFGGANTANQSVFTSDLGEASFYCESSGVNASQNLFQFIASSEL